MHHAHSGIAVPDLVAQDADADQVVDVVEVAALDDHLLVDRPIVLGAPLHGGLDLRCTQRGDDLGTDLGQVGVARRRSAGHQAHDLVILLGMQDGERQVFELPLDAGHPQSMRQGGNDFQCLAGLACLLLRGQKTHGAHVVQPVGHLDHQHPRIASHGGDHFADGLAFGGATEHDPVQLGHPVDKMAHLLAELFGKRLEGVSGVFDGVVQQRRHQGGAVHAQLGQDVGNRQRVGDVRITGMPELAGVALVGDLVSPLQQRKVGLGVHLAVHRHQWLENRVDGAALSGYPTGQPGTHPTGGAAGCLEGLSRRRLGRLYHRWRLDGRHDCLRRALVIGHRRHLQPRGYLQSWTCPARSRPLPAQTRPGSDCAPATARSPRDRAAPSVRPPPPPRSPWRQCAPASALPPRGSHPWPTHHR